MKTFPFVGAAALLLAWSGCAHLAGDPHSKPKPSSTPDTLSSFDTGLSSGDSFPPGTINFQDADLAQVLSIYAAISRRSTIQSAHLPQVQITYRNQIALTPVETLQALDTVLAAQEITMVMVGDQVAKAVPSKEAYLEPGPLVELEPDQLPESSSYLTYIVRVKNVAPSRIAATLAPFSQLPQGVVVIAPGDSPGPRAAMPGLERIKPPSKGETLVVLRDYSGNVRRMLQVLERMQRR